MPNNSSKQNGKRGAYYWNGDKPYISVTEILKVIDKPALRWWFGKEVYLAMLADPTLGEKEALAAPYQKSKTAMNRGSTVHSIVESYTHTKEHIETIPEDFKGYAQAFYKYIESVKGEIILHEQTVISEKHRYAGTLDIFIKIEGYENPFVMDIKTGKDIYQESFLQTTAYRIAFESVGQKIDGVGTLLLMEDGSYKVQVATDTKKYEEGFLACLTLYRSLNDETLKKLGYYEQ